VDVADVSAMHVRALDRPGTAGKRYIASAASATMPEIARHLARRHPDRRIATRIAPVALLRVLGLFDRSIKTALQTIGPPPEFANARAREELGIDFTPWQTAVDRAAEAVLALKR
jgi:dihydroflavonol-4-reductase